MTILNKAMRWIILGSLLLVAACANGGSGPGSTANYGSSYNQDYYGPGNYPEQDPQFWQMWQDRQGGG